MAAPTRLIGPVSRLSALIASKEAPGPPGAVIRTHAHGTTRTQKNARTRLTGTRTPRGLKRIEWRDESRVQQNPQTQHAPRECPSQTKESEALLQRSAPAQSQRAALGPHAGTRGCSHVHAHTHAANPPWGWLQLLPPGVSVASSNAGRDGSATFRALLTW